MATGKAKISPSLFVTDHQLRVHQPLTVLDGISKCVCGCDVDRYGDHLLSCKHLHTYRMPWHDGVLDVFLAIARNLGPAANVVVDSRRPRACSSVYSPLWCPDCTLIGGSNSGSHLIVDVTCPSVVKSEGVQAAAVKPLMVAASAEASKHGKYGRVAPNVLLPFVVEHAGALGPAAREFFMRVKTHMRDQLAPRDEATSTWSSRGFSNFYH